VDRAFLKPNWNRERSPASEIALSTPTHTSLELAHQELAISIDEAYRGDHEGSSGGFPGFVRSSSFWFFQQVGKTSLVMHLVNAFAKVG